MDRLPRRDLRSLDEFLRECYAIRNLQAFPHHILSGLPKLVRSEITTYNEFDSRRARVTRLWDPPDADFPDSKKIFERHIREHPVIAHRVRTNDGQALTLSDFLTRNQFHRLALYNEFYRRLGVEYVISVVIPARPPALVAVPLNRGRQDFSERERSLLNVLQPHLVQAYRNAEAPTRTEQELTLRRRMHYLLDQDVMSVTREGRIRFINPRAQQWMAEYFDSAGRLAGRVPDVLGRWIREQETPRAGKDNLPPPRKPLVVERGGKRLVARLLSHPVESLILLEERQTALQPAAFEALGLTRREAEVLTWVAQGKTNKEIATILGTSARTVGKQLEHVYLKLGVETRTAAAKLALSSSPSP